MIFSRFTSVMFIDQKVLRYFVIKPVWDENLIDHSFVYWYHFRGITNKLSPFLRVRTIHSTDFQKLKNSTGGSYYSSMPKAWSTPPVDFQKLIKQTEGQNLIGCLSGPEGYKGLKIDYLCGWLYFYFRAFVGDRHLFGNRAGANWKGAANIQGAGRTIQKACATLAEGNLLIN